VESYFKGRGIMEDFLNLIRGNESNMALHIKPVFVA